MEAKNVKELREMARKLGLTGYSKLRRDELIRLLAASKPAAKSRPAKGSAPVARKRNAATRKPQPAARSADTPAPASKQPAGQMTARGASRVSGASPTDLQIESAKYELTPPGQPAQGPVYATDLGEDIDQLPDPAEPLLCLLPQKPGVLHGYWAIPANIRVASDALHLRLAHVAGEELEIINELPLPADRGHWYFHLDADTDYGAVYLQLGYYRPDGRFITAIDRGIARIPSLYASDLTDRRWWISGEQFRRMYQRAGGFRRDRRLGWAASISSR